MFLARLQVPNSILLCTDRDEIQVKKRSGRADSPYGDSVVSPRQKTNRFERKHSGERQANPTKRHAKKEKDDSTKTIAENDMHNPTKPTATKKENSKNEKDNTVRQLVMDLQEFSDEEEEEEEEEEKDESGC